MAHHKLISALAVLKVNADHSKSYLDNFVPFVAEAIRLTGESVISVPEIRKVLKNELGIEIPHHVVSNILSSMCKDGRIIKESKKYVATSELLRDTTFSKRKNEITRKQKRLSNSFEEFSKRNGYQLETCDDLESCFYSFIESNFTEIVRGNGNGLKEKSSIPCASAAKMNYAASRFVKHISEEDDALYQVLEDIVKGNMLYNSIFFVNHNEVKTKFKGTEVYFDTSIILYLLGFTSKERSLPYQELCRLLKITGAKSCCFEHTVEEVRNVLRYCIEMLKKGTVATRNEALDYLIENHKTPSDVELLIGDLEERLYRIGVIVKPKPSYVNAFCLDEAKLEKYISDAVSYRNEEVALQFDVDSISAIHRLREGTFYSNIEQCRAVFVTPNSQLAQAARDFHHDEYPSKSGVSYCVLSHVLTTVAWMKLPTLPAELPKQVIISNCYAGLKPTPEVWDKYIDQVERLFKDKEISEDSYYILKNSLFCSEALAEVSGGDVANVTADSVSEILRKATLNIVGDAREALASTKNELQETYSKIHEHDEKLRKYALKIADCIYCILGTSYVLLVLYFAYLSKPDEISVDAILAGNPIAFLALCGMILGTCLMLLSSDARRWGMTGRNMLAGSVFSKLVKIFGVN